MSEQEQTNVNYDAIHPASTGLDDPYDDALAFRSLLGAVHGEFDHMVNNNMVSESSTLKKVNGRSILEKGVNELMSRRQPVNNPLPQPQQMPQIPPPIQQAPIVPPPVPEPIPITDSNQLELNFNKTATINEIFDKLENIDIKLSKIEKILENFQSTKKKTLVKK